MIELTSIWAWLLTPVGMILAMILAYKFKNKLPFTSKRTKKWHAAAVVGGILFLVGGGIASCSPLTMTQMAGESCHITDLQLNSITFTNTSATAQVSNTQEDTFEIRATDAQWAATDTIDVDITAVRSGSSACSVPVSVTVPSFKSETDLTDTAIYTLVEQGTDQKHECYIEVDGTGTPSTSDAKQSTVLGYVEGDVSNMISVLCDDLLDELDEMNTYSRQNLYVNIGNKVARIEIMKTG